MLNTNSEKKGGALSGLYKRTVKSFKSVKSAFNNAIAEILDVNGHGKYYYGVNDRLPNEIIEYINNSGTATSCVEKLDQFTQADGFNSLLLASKKINGKQTWNQLLADISGNTAYLQAYALRVLFNNDLKIHSLESIPYQTLRRRNGGFDYNELMGEYGHIQSEDLFMKEYEPGVSPERRRALINSQIEQYGKQVGEVLYVFKKRNGRLYSKYSVPNFYSGIADIISDGKLSEFELRNISQGWRGNIIISSGPVDNINKDENEKTEQDYWDEALSDFVGEDAASVIHLKGKTNEDKPTVTVLNLADLVDATDKASVRIPNRVCRLMTVPPVLIGIATPGQLGNVQELQNSMELFKMSVLNRQRMIQESLQSLKADLPIEYANEDFSISQLNIFSGNVSEPAKPGAVAKNVDPNQDAIDSMLRSMSRSELSKLYGYINDYKKGKATYEQTAIFLRAYKLTDEQIKLFLEDTDGDGIKDT